MNPDFSPPDEFTSSPLLCLVPEIGDIAKLEVYSSAIFARYEKISSLVKEFENNGLDDSISIKFQREKQMLREVLGWLGISV